MDKQEGEEAQDIHQRTFRLRYTGHAGVPGVYADRVHMVRTQGRVVLSFFQHVFPIEPSAGEIEQEDELPVVHSALVARVMLTDETAHALVDILAEEQPAVAETEPDGDV